MIDTEYRQVTHLDEQYSFFEAGIRQYEEEIETAFLRRITEQNAVGPPLPGDLDLKPLFAALRRDAEIHKEKLIDSESSLFSELSTDEAARKERDEAFEETRTAIMDLRNVIVGNHGLPAAFALGFSRRTSQRKFALYRQGKRILGGLRNPKIDVPPSRWGTSLDREAAAVELEKSVARLGVALERMKAEERQAESARREKNLAIEENKTCLSRNQALLIALAAWAGKEELRAALTYTPPRRTVGEGDTTTGDGVAQPELIADQAQPPTPTGRAAAFDPDDPITVDSNTINPNTINPNTINPALFDTRNPSTGEHAAV